MTLLLMVVLVGMTLSALIVPMIISQNQATRFNATRVQSLDAAQAGVDVAVGLIRGATTVDPTGALYGDSSKLPCGLLSGAVNSNGAASYSTRIEYFTFDPTNEPDDSNTVADSGKTVPDPATMVPDKKAMNCVTGYGVFDPSSGLYTPNFARIYSRGTVGSAVNGSSAGRLLVTTFVFKTTGTGVSGGTIQLGYSTPALCMDAGSPPFVAGSNIRLLACSAIPGQQTFSYRTDLTLQLLPSVTTANPNGLCLTPTPLPPAANGVVQLGQCGALGTPPYNEQWSLNNGKYQASVTTSASDGGLPDLCITGTSSLTLVSCSSASSWTPAASVGLGGATRAQLLWSSYSETGRCLDVNNADVNTTHLISYPCKQNPNAGAVGWNQKFVAPSLIAGQASITGQFYTTVPGNSTKYCVTSPGTIGGYVTLGPPGSGGQPCGSGSVGATQTWTFFGNDRSLAYASMYTIVDSTGLCLGVTAAVGGEAWSAVDVERCTGAANQKWGVSANALGPSLQNTREVKPVTNP